MNTDGENLFDIFTKQQEVVCGLQMKNGELESHLKSTNSKIRYLETMVNMLQDMDQDTKTKIITKSRRKQ